jgi:tetratricopeptide (TPR) repeat protein
MNESSDRNLWQQVRASSFSLIGEAKRAQKLASQSEQTLDVAKKLLQQVRLAPLEDGDVADTIELLRYAPCDRPFEQLLAANEHIQQAYADLKKGLHRLAQEQVRAEAWREAETILDPLCRVNPDYGEAAALQKRVRLLRAASEALTGEHWDMARQLLEAWLQTHSDDAKARDMLCEAYYHLGLAAVQDEKWENAAQHLQRLNKLSPKSRDVATLVTQHPLLAWLTGEIGIVRELVSDAGAFRKVVFSPNGQLLAGLSNGKALVWDVETGCLRHVIASERGEIRELQFSPVGQLLAACDKPSEYLREHRTKEGWSGVEVWDPETGQMCQAREWRGVWQGAELLERAPNHTNGVLFSPDGAQLLSEEMWEEGGYYRTVMFRWDVGSGYGSYKVKAADHLAAGIFSVAFSGNKLALGYSDMQMRIWDLEHGFGSDPYCTLRMQGGADSLVFSPTGFLLAAAARFPYHGIQVGNAGFYYHPPDLKPLEWRTSRSHTSLCFSSDDRLLAAHTSAREHPYASLCIWDISTRKLLYQQSNQDWLYGSSIAFSPDGRLLALGNDNGKVTLLGFSEL